jgi:hypothetical protein
VRTRGRPRALHIGNEVIDIAKRNEFGCNEVAEFLRLSLELVDQLGPTVDQNDDVVDVETGENIVGAAPKPRRELGRYHDRRCGRPDPLPGWQFLFDRRGDRELVPRIRKSEYLLGGRHHIDRQTRSAMTPTADDRLVHRLLESTVAQALGQSLVLHVAGHVTNHVDVVGRAYGRCRSLRQPQVHGCAADEDHLADQWPEDVGR